MQVVIYDIDGTFLYPSLDAADEKIKGLYGQKLGAEACARLYHSRPGTVYRRYGGPRIEIVSDADAERIRIREKAAGILHEKSWTAPAASNYSRSRPWQKTIFSEKVGTSMGQR